MVMWWRNLSLIVFVLALAAAIYYVWGDRLPTNWPKVQLRPQQQAAPAAPSCSPDEVSVREYCDGPGLTNCRYTCISRLGVRDGTIIER